VLPYASCLSTFRSPGWGTPAILPPYRWRTQLCGSRYLSAIIRLQGFSSRGPTAPSRRWSPKTVTTSSWMGRSKPGCGPRLSLSFKDAYHPCWGGERGEPGLYLPHESAGHLLFQLLVVETIPQLCGGGVLQPCRGRRNVAADDATPGGCSPRGRVGLCRGKADPSLMTKTLRGSEVYEQLESILRVEAT
jgi:hypothetical protein